MKLRIVKGTLLLFLFAMAKVYAAPIDIPFETFTLPNGLRVVVHTDHKAPVVALNIWYHVGSKDEPLGKSGFAHLFEHLMFNGSENYRGEFFTPFKSVGVTDQNGTTNSDRTNYFETVPTTALDTALFMESDRMGHLLGAINQATLDEQRGVVQNEKRQGENRPYGRVEEFLVKALYPKGHPYYHSTIGSMNDLNAASLEDVKNWFRSWYGPNNAVLVLAGDIDLATAKEKVTAYFGDIPATPTLPKLPVQIAARKSSTRQTITDRVPQPLILQIWNTPAYGDADVERLQLFAQVLGGSESSRLAQRLFFTEKLVDEISASVSPSELGGTFAISAVVKDGVDPKAVERAIVQVLKQLLAKGPTQAELDQARTVFVSQFIRGLERVGGFGGKSDVLAECAVYTGDPGCYRTQLARIERSTPKEVQATARRWLSRGDHTLTVLKGEVTQVVEAPAVAAKAMKLPPVDPQFTTVPSSVDRKKGVALPEVFPALSLPALSRAKLSNGLQVVLAERHSLPLVQMSLRGPGGFSTDGEGKAGEAAFTMYMLAQGAGNYDAIGLARRTESLGAVISSSAVLDAYDVSLSALKEKLGESLAIYADVILRPHFATDEIERERSAWIGGIQQEKGDASSLLRRIVPGVVYGKGHPYAQPASGRGDEAAIAMLSRDDMIAWQKAHMRPDQSTLFIVGDTTLAEIMPLLEKALGSWKAPESAATELTIPSVSLPKQTRVFLVDQPSSIQANIAAAQVSPSSLDARTIDFDIANDVIGGDFTSRINMNLREDKHWSYGASSRANPAVGPRLWQARAPVQIDKTVDAIKELQREITSFATLKSPPTLEEMNRVKAFNSRTLPGAFEVNAAVLGVMMSNALYHRPDDYVMQRKDAIEKASLADFKHGAEILQPPALTWVVVGDLSKIEAGIRALNLGPVTVLDADGKVVR